MLWTLISPKLLLWPTKWKSSKLWRLLLLKRQHKNPVPLTQTRNLTPTLNLMMQMAPTRKMSKLLVVTRMIAAHLQQLWSQKRETMTRETVKMRRRRKHLIQLMCNLRKATSSRHSHHQLQLTQLLSLQPPQKPSQPKQPRNEDKFTVKSVQYLP